MQIRKSQNVRNELYWKGCLSWTALKTSKYIQPLDTEWTLVWGQFLSQKAFCQHLESWNAKGDFPGDFIFKMRNQPNFRNTQVLTRHYNRQTNFTISKTYCIRRIFSKYHTDVFKGVSGKTSLVSLKKDW